MLRSFLAATVLAGAMMASSAQAGTPVTIQVTCPLTGETFNFETTASYSTWGRDLDGLPQGSWHFPLDLPQCPDSRFPVLEDLTPEQLAAAAALVQTPGYAAVRDEAPYYLLAFVMRELGIGDPIDPDWNLLQATWQVRDQPEIYSRYATELVSSWDAGSAAFRSENSDDWRWIESFIANVERQAGRFEDASARLDALEPMAADDEGLMQRISTTRRLIAEGNSRPFSPERGD